MEDNWTRPIKQIFKYSSIYENEVSLVIHKRIYNELEERIRSSQFGFSDGLGTKAVLLSVLYENKDVTYNVRVCSINYDNDFDVELHDKLQTILKSVGTDYK